MSKPWDADGNTISDPQIEVWVTEKGQTKNEVLEKLKSRLIKAGAFEVDTTIYERSVAVMGVEETKKRGMDKAESWGRIKIVLDVEDYFETTDRGEIIDKLLQRMMEERPKLVREIGDGLSGYVAFLRRPS